MSQKTKARLILACCSLVFILLIVSLILHDNTANKAAVETSSSDSEIASATKAPDHPIGNDSSDTDISPELQSVIDDVIYDTNGVKWGNAINDEAEARLDNDSNLEDDPCEEWTTVDASGYLCNAVSYDDPELNGTITVGVDGSYIEGSTGGLILQINYSNAAPHNAVGVTFTCDTGTIGYASENGIAQLTGTSGLTKVQRDIYPGASANDAPVVALGRTWDYQLDLTYYSPTDFGVCWYYDPMSAPPENAIITFRMFDLTSGSIFGIYEIHIINVDGVMTLDSVQPYQVSDTTLSCTDQIKELVSTASDQVPFNIDLADENIYLQNLRSPYYLDAKLLDGTTFKARYADLYGQLVGVTVNSNSSKLGPVTYYFAITQDASDFSIATGSGYSTRLIGYELPITWSWDLFTEFNALDTSSDSFLAYSPQRD